MSFWKYLKSAFLNRWNLLVAGGALGFASLSPIPDVLIPMVAAAELLYVGLLSSHPRFQAAVEAQEHKAAQGQSSEGTDAALKRILQSLPQRSLQRFEALQGRCVELRQIALELRDPGREASPVPLESLQLSGLDRLLWIFLRLLFTQHSLERFLASTSEDQIEREIARLEERIRKIGESGSESTQGKIKKALEDNIETLRVRLQNIGKARDNNELVKVEIDRLENKIHSLGELAINRHEPEFIAAQVDQVASSMTQTEQTMSELQFATGLALGDEAVPELVERERLKASR